MKNGQIEFRKEDFLEYRSLQAQLKFYEDQYKDLCIQMLKFEEVKLMFYGVPFFKNFMFISM